MAGIREYIDWRGDIRWDVSPFNEVDYYVISKIGSPDLSKALPEDATSVSVKECVHTYFEKLRGSTNLGVLASKDIMKVFRILPLKERYSDLGLSGFQSVFSESAVEQFSALTVLLPDGTCFISFRGTDDTLVAWKEDLKMGVHDVVPAQEDARAYLEWAASVYDGPLLVGGHSKGGNLAVYAAATVSPEIQGRIRSVYSFDGPGFRSDFFATEGYLRIEGRIHEIVPETAIVGTLLLKGKPYEVVKCRYSGIPSHDGYKWETTPLGFLHVPSLTDTSIALDEAMDKLFFEMSPDEISSFIEELFSVLSDSGAKTITDLADRTLLGNLLLTRKLIKGRQIRELGSRIIENTVRCRIRK